MTIDIYIYLHNSTYIYTVTWIILDHPGSTFAASPQLPTGTVQLLQRRGRNAAERSRFPRPKADHCAILSLQLNGPWRWLQAIQSTKRNYKQFIDFSWHFIDEAGTSLMKLPFTMILNQKRCWFLLGFGEEIYCAYLGLMLDDRRYGYTLQLYQFKPL